MKRVFLFAFALLTMGNAFAQTVSVNDVYVRPGETAQFAVNVTFPEGKADTYTAMTLYVQFPTTGFTTTDASISSLWVDATKSVGSVDNTGLATIPFASENAIPGSTVDNVVSVRFAVGSTVAYNDYEVTLKGTMFEYGTSGAKDYAADVKFTVHVTDKVVLDENSPFAPQAYSSPMNVIVKRTIKAGEWSTICLPFAMTATQFRDIFGDDVKLAFFQSYDVEKEGTAITNISLAINEFPLSNVGFLANYPYLIFTTKDISQFEIENISINPNPAVVQYTDGNQWSPTVYGSFIGTYAANTILPTYSLFLSGNKFYYSAGKTKMKAFRAYFTLQDVLTEVSNANARITMSFDDGETTGIKTVDKKVNDKYYNLRGQQVKTPARGIYVKDGNKVIIK